MNPSEVEELQYAISHDLYRPSRQLKQFFEIYESLEDKSSQDAIEIWNFMKKSINESCGMFDDINDFLEIQLTKPNLDEFSLSEFFKILSAKINVKLNIQENMPNIKADKDLFTRLANEIIENSLKFNAEKEDLKIEIKHEQKSLIFKDNGTKVSSSNIKSGLRLFKKMHAENIRGHGSGLAIANKISIIHGWKLDINSSENEGFTVSIIM